MREIPPYRPYQATGHSRILAKEFYGLFWEMRLGKSKPVVGAWSEACGGTNHPPVLVVAAPSQCAQVWFDRDFGELAKHCPLDDRTVVKYESGKWEKWLGQLVTEGDPVCIIASQEFLRQSDAKGNFHKVDALRAALAGRRYWLVVDEASNFGSDKSANFKSHLELQDGAEKTVTLDGTPVGDSPMEQWAKFELLHKGLLGYQNYFHFRGVHGIRGGFKGKTIVGFKNQEWIDRKVRPFCEYLTQGDCGIELPKFVPSFLNSELKPKTWNMYRQMRDELVAELDRGVMAVNHASQKVLRLAQITAGWLGGAPKSDGLGEGVECVQVGTEADDELARWLEDRLKRDKEFKCVVWCRWRPQIVAVHARLKDRFQGLRLGQVWGDVKDENFLSSDHPYRGPGIIVAQPQAMRYGVNCSKADTEIFHSQDYRLVTRQQAEQRLQNTVEAVGRRHTHVLDMLVWGPQGQRTVTHDIKACQEQKRTVANRTASEWKKILMEE
jgi:hypothetical protein